MIRDLIQIQLQKQCKTYSPEFDNCFICGSNIKINDYLLATCLCEKFSIMYYSNIHYFLYKTKNDCLTTDQNYNAILLNSSKVNPVRYVGKISSVAQIEKQIERIKKLLVLL